MSEKPTYEELERLVRQLNKAESKRKQMELEYKAIVRTAMDGFWLVDMQGHLLDVNDAFCHLTGYSRDELLNMSILDIEASEKPEETEARIRKIKEVRQDRFETRHRGKDGKVVDVEISVNYLPTDEGRMFVFIRDISERIRAEEALRESEEKYRTLFDIESDALALIEIETGKMLDVNKAFIELYGYSKEEILRMKNTDFSAEPEITKQATQARGTYVPIRYHKKKDGTVFPTEITARIFKYQERDVHIAAIRDITERKRLETQLQQAQRMEAICRVSRFMRLSCHVS